jgi:hypothetical protein
MTRPTPEKMAEYERRAAGEPEHLQGVSIVGNYLADLMRERGFDDDEVENACFSLGRLCFGRDRWEAFDLMWAKVQADSEEEERRKTYGDTPVEQAVPEPTDLLTDYLRQVRVLCGDKGVYPQPLLYRDTEGQITMCAVAADGGHCVKVARDALARGDVEEMVFGLDRSARPGQGLEFDDFVSMVWYVGGDFYTAVINYVPAAAEGDRIIRDPDWDNNWWNNQMRAGLLPSLRAAIKEV